MLFASHEFGRLWVDSPYSFASDDISVLSNRQTVVRLILQEGKKSRVVTVNSSDLFAY